MVFKISKILEKGRFNWKGLNNILHDHEERLDALEGSGSGSQTTYDDTALTNRIKAVEDRVTALESASQSNGENSPQPEG